MKVKIRKFIESDIPYKVRWINDKETNKYLHYDLPLTIDKTIEWFKSIKNKNNRADFTILVDNKPVGIIGLLNIDNKNRKAEFYVTIGEKKGNGIGFEATKLLLEMAYRDYNLNKIYLYTEVNNIAAQKLFEKIGFIKEGYLKDDLIYSGRKIDRLLYAIYLDEIFK